MGKRSALGRITTRPRPPAAGPGGVVETVRANDSTPPPLPTRPPRATGPIDPGWLALPTDESAPHHDDEATATVPSTTPTPPPFAVPKAQSQPLIDADAPTVVDPELQTPHLPPTGQGEGVFVTVPPVAVEDLSSPIHEMLPVPKATRRPIADASQPLSPIAPEHIPRRAPSQGIFGSAVTTNPRRVGPGNPALIALVLFVGAAAITTVLLVVF